MSGGTSVGLRTAARSLARGVGGAIAPALLRKVQLARARARYTRPPQRGPRRVQVEVTTGCNYRCVMCTDHSSLLERATPPHMMPWERVEALLRETAEMGAEQVWLAGRGEPLVYPEAVKTIALASSLGLETVITTNGNLLDEARLDALCDAGLSKISISINSGCPETYAYVHGGRPEERERLLGLMARLSHRPQRPWLSTSMVLLKPNHTEMLDFVRDAIRVGANAIDMLGLRSAEHFPRLELSDEEWDTARRDLATAQALANEAGVWFRAHCLPPAPGQAPADAPAPDRTHWGLGCFVGYQVARVAVDGSVHGCCSCTNHLGRLDGASFREIWYSPAYDRFRHLCRELPVTGVAPRGCSCVDCGNLIDNEEAYRELQFLPLPRSTEGGLVTRLNLAEVVWEELGELLAAPGEATPYCDLSPAQAGAAWAAVAGLQSAGAMRGRPLPEGPSEFAPRRLATYAEVAIVLQRCTAGLGLPDGAAEHVLAQSRSSFQDYDPVLRGEVRGWARVLRAAAAQGARRR